MIRLIAQKNIGTIEPIGNRFADKAIATDQSGKAAIGTVEAIFTTLFGFLTIVAGLTFLVYFVIGALQWITAGGDSKKVESARSYMINGAVGLIIIIAAYSIISIVGTVLGLNILDLEAAINQIMGSSKGAN